MYEEVWKALNNNSCIGIFPEGGSHDRTDLLPLKAGICIMALGAMQKYGKKVIRRVLRYFKSFTLDNNENNYLIIRCEIG